MKLPVEQVLRLSGALERLSRADRDMIRLRHFEHLSLARISERTGTSVAKVAKAWVRALERLRAILGEP